MSFRSTLFAMICLVFVMFALSVVYIKPRPKKHNKHPEAAASAAPAAAAALPKDLWIASRLFDIGDENNFRILHDMGHPTRFFCFNAAPFVNDSDEELRQVFWQAIEANIGMNAESECKLRDETAVQPVCHPLQGKFSYDYIKKECVPVETVCVPGTRFRMVGSARRVFLRIYDEIESCKAGPRAPGVP